MVEVHCYNLVDTSLEVVVCPKFLVGRNIGHAEVVREQHAHHIFGGVCHVDLSTKRRLFRQIWQGAAVIEMEMRHQEQVDFSQIHVIEVWERIVTTPARMDAAVRWPLLS